MRNSPLLMSGQADVLTLKVPQSPCLPFASDVALEIPLRGVTAIFGESGQGKTRLLRLIAGLDKVAGATVGFGDDYWQNNEQFMPAYKRPVACVFQQNSLLGHLSGEDNLRYVLKRRNASASIDDFSAIIALLDIRAVLNRKPHQMSGGEQQRVAIAAALVSQPKLLLMDEPLASLDTSRKRQILPYLEQLHRVSDIPIVYVSHSVDEVKRLADHIVWLDEQHIAFSGALSEGLQHLPLAQHLGPEAGVVIQANVKEIALQWHLAYVVFGDHGLWVKDEGLSLGQLIRLRVNAQDVSIALDNQDKTSIANRLPSCVADIHDLDDPAMAMVVLTVGQQQVLAKLTKRSVHSLQLEKGQTVWMQVKSVAII